MKKISFVKLSPNKSRFSLKGIQEMIIHMKAEDLGILLSEFIPDFIIANGQKQIAWISPEFDKLHHNSIFGKDFGDIFPCSKEKKTCTEVKLDGQKYFIEYRDIAVDDESYALLVFRKNATSLTTEEKLFCLEEIIKNLHEGVIFTDYNQKIVLYNPTQEKLELLDSKDTLGRSTWEVYNYSINDSEHKNVFDSGKPIINKYRAFNKSDGIPRYTSYSTYPIIKGNKKLGVFSINENETTLQNLLMETIELKRKLFAPNKHAPNNTNNNGANFTFSDIIGNSPAMKSLIKEAQLIATINTPVLIIGETGTGKEVLAQSIHNHGRPKERFVAINCAAIPETLLEAILFGTQKGSFTGALDKIGLFEDAGAGTLFLDEINSMSMPMQAKLLRVLQEKQVRRIGGLESIPIYCRVISAMNEDPKISIDSGKFRPDLFYRIAGFSLYIPPLRERVEDIFSMTFFFIEKYNKEFNKHVKKLSPKLTGLLTSYNWPGNIRELEHVIQNLMLRIDESKTELSSDLIPKYMHNMLSVNNLYQEKLKSLPQSLQELERKRILESLHMNNWNLTKTAHDLGIIRQSLFYRMKKLNIDSP